MARRRRNPFGGASIGTPQQGMFGGQPTIGSIGQGTYGGATSTYGGGRLRRPRIGGGLAQASSGSFASGQQTIGNPLQAMFGNQPSIGTAQGGMFGGLPPSPPNSIGTAQGGMFGGSTGTGAWIEGYDNPTGDHGSVGSIVPPNYSGGSNPFGFNLVPNAGVMPTTDAGSSTGAGGGIVNNVLSTGRGKRRGYRGQAGVSTTGFYEAGVEAAQAAFQAGGVNALLAFLAGYNAGQ